MVDHAALAIGFAFTVVAGLATVLGTAFISILKRVPAAEGHLTSGALAFAAGVMMYVSFVDVLSEEAKEKFIEHFQGHEADAKKTERRLAEEETPIKVRIMIAVFFFLGLALGMVLHWFTGDNDEASKDGRPGRQSSSRSIELAPTTGSRVGAELAAPTHWDGEREVAPSPSAGNSFGPHRRSVAALERVSLVAFMALTVHNVPEGLATFFSGEQLNWKIPFAIALHNIPEGAAIAIPHFQVTGKLFEAFMRTLIAGLAQPVGALLGWFLIIIFQFETLPSFLYGVMYATTAGIMVCVSIVELIPEALASGSSFFVGSLVFTGFLLMEVSIICLELSGA